MLDLRTLQRWLLKVFFTILFIALSLIWMSEAWLRQDVNGIDQVAYPTVLSLIGTSLILLQWWPQYYTLAVLGTVGTTCVYTVSFLQGIIWGYIPMTDEYNLSTFAQWFPLTYILLFIFLSKRQALAIALCIYTTLVGSTVINAYLERHLTIAQQKFPYLIHLVMSHPIYIAVFFAVSMLQMSFAAAKLRAERADIDHLTELANRHAATRLLETALAANAQQTFLGVILVDVDRFKAINDTYGHGVGDRVLIQVAQLLKEGLGQTDLAARWGGEEFLIVLLNAQAQAVSETAERLCHRLAAYCHPTVGQVTASFGIATAVSGTETLDSLLTRADEALYRAKKQGRNQVVDGDNMGQQSVVENGLIQLKTSEKYC